MYSRKKFFYKMIAVFHWHKNDYFDIIYVMEGESQCFFRQEKLELVEGDVLIVPPDI